MYILPTLQTTAITLKMYECVYLCVCIYVYIYVYVLKMNSKMYEINLLIYTGIETLSQSFIYGFLYLLKQDE